MPKFHQPLSLSRTLPNTWGSKTSSIKVVNWPLKVSWSVAYPKSPSLEVALKGASTFSDLAVEIRCSALGLKPNKNCFITGHCIH